MLGNTSQKKTYGRQIMGSRLPISPRGSSRGKAGPGRFPEWISHRGSFQTSFVTAGPARPSMTMHKVEDGMIRVIRYFDAGTEIACA
jgi:hypothetical protein